MSSEESQLRQQLQQQKPSFYQRFPPQEFHVYLGLGLDESGRDPCIKLEVELLAEISEKTLIDMIQFWNPLPVVVKRQGTITALYISPP